MAGELDRSVSPTQNCASSGLAEPGGVTASLTGLAAH